MTDKHTATPWEQGKNIKSIIFMGEEIPDSELNINNKRPNLQCLSNGEPNNELDQANAAHIVRCVNSHDALVEALEYIKTINQNAAYGLVEITKVCKAALKAARGE